MTKEILESFSFPFFMTSEELFRHAESGTDYLISQRPFACVGTLKATFDSGDVRRWLFDQEGNIVAVAIDEDDGMWFKWVSESLDMDGDIVAYAGLDFEFAYEDTGTFSDLEGDTGLEEDEPFSLTEYEAESGEVLRIVVQEASGSKQIFFGKSLPLKEIQETE